MPDTVFCNSVADKKCKSLAALEVGDRVTVCGPDGCCYSDKITTTGGYSAAALCVRWGRNYGVVAWFDRATGQCENNLEWHIEPAGEPVKGE